MTRLHRFLGNAVLGLFVATVVACTDRPTQPSVTPSAEVATVVSDNGLVSTSAVTLQRIRLRRVNGPDIVTALVDGQVIDVPVNVLIDIWAEVRYESTDPVPRLNVDWNMDAPGGDRDNVHCGPCRIEKTYRTPGRYRVRVTVDDRAGGLISRTVTLNVQAPAPTPPPTPGAPVGCTSIDSDFDSFAHTTPLAAVAIAGASFTSDVGGDEVFDLSGVAGLGGSSKLLDGHVLLLLTVGNPPGVDVALSADHTSLNVAFAALSPQMVTLGATYKAFDAAGNIVATGTVVPTSFGYTADIFGVYEGTLAFSGVPFRKLQIRAPAQPGVAFLMLDHLTIGCN